MLFSQPVHGLLELFPAIVGQIVFIQEFPAHGIDAHTAVKSHPADFSIFFHVEEIGHGTGCVAGGCHGGDGGIAQGQGVAIVQENVRFKGFGIFHIQFHRIAQIQLAVGIIPICPANDGFGTGEFHQRPGTAEMVDMSMGMKDVFQIHGIQTQGVHMVNHQIQ